MHYSHRHNHDHLSTTSGSAHSSKPKQAPKQGEQQKAPMKAPKADGTVSGGIGATGGEEAESVVGEKWYEEAEAAAIEIKGGKQHKKLPAGAATQCYDRAMALLEGMVTEHGKNNKKNADRRWLGTVLSKGTLSDRVSAMTLLVSDAPLYNLSLLKNIVEMCSKNNRREAGLAIEATKDLFIYNLLPPGRKLQSFEDQPLGAILSSDANNAAKDAQLVTLLTLLTLLSLLTLQTLLTRPILGILAVGGHHQASVFDVCGRAHGESQAGSPIC
jgi:hypothetical protein